MRHGGFSVFVEDIREGGGGGGSHRRRKLQTQCIGVKQERGSINRDPQELVLVWGTGT